MKVQCKGFFFFNYCCFIFKTSMNLQHCNTKLKKDKKLWTGVRDEHINLLKSFTYLEKYILYQFLKDLPIVYLCKNMTQRRNHEIVAMRKNQSQYFQKNTTATLRCPNGKGSWPNNFQILLSIIYEKEQVLGIWKTE